MYSLEVKPYLLLRRVVLAALRRTTVLAALRRTTVLAALRRTVVAMTWVSRDANQSDAFAATYACWGCWG
jgi:hypothetical protein